MSYFRTDDPAADFDRRDRQQAKWLASRPVCVFCGEHIQDEHCYLINDEFVCPDCLDRDFKKWTDDFIDQ